MFPGMWPIPVALERSRIFVYFSTFFTDTFSSLNFYSVLHLAFVMYSVSASSNFFFLQTVFTEWFYQIWGNSSKRYLRFAYYRARSYHILFNGIFHTLQKAVLINSNYSKVYFRLYSFFASFSSKYCFLLKITFFSYYFKVFTCPVFFVFLEIWTLRRILLYLAVVYCIFDSLHLLCHIFMNCSLFARCYS